MNEFYYPSNIQERLKISEHDVLFGRNEDLLEQFNNGWHVGQSYEKEPCTQYRCKICGSDKFEVGYDSYFTALRCPNCKYEVCVHDG